MDHPDSDKKAGAEEASHAEHNENSLVLTEPVKEERHTVSAGEEEGQSLVSTIVMVIGAIILIILLVLFARWIYHAVNGSGQPSSGVVQQPSEPANPGSQSGGSQQPSSPNNSGTKSQPQPNQNNKPLTNTGPGNVAAVFAGSALAAAGLHYIISLRRFSKHDG